MQYVKYLAAVVAVCLMAAGSSFASAKSKDNGPLTIADSPVRVGSTSLKPGAYKVEWTGQGNNVHVDVLKGKKVVATALGKIVDMTNPSPNNAVVIKTLKDKTRKLVEVDFNNRKQALVITPSTTAMR